MIPASLSFMSTAELAVLEGVIGQDGAVDATTSVWACVMRDTTCSSLALGRTGKTSTMKRILARAAEIEPPPSDYCYVHNFQDSYRPTALALPTGRGGRLRQEMQRLVEEGKLRLQRAFESEEFERQKWQTTRKKSAAASKGRWSNSRWWSAARSSA